MHPELEEDVMDKLLTLEANELDLLLQFPSAVEITIKDLQRVLDSQGKQALERYAVPLLSYEQIQGLKLEAPPSEPRPLLEAGDENEKLITNDKEDHELEINLGQDTKVTNQEASKDAATESQCKVDLD